MRPRKRARHRSNSQVVIPRQVNTRSNAQRNDLPSAEPGSSTQHSLMTPADPIHNNEDLFALVGEALSPIPSRTSGSVTESQSASTVRESTAPAITARSTTLANRIAPVNLIASANPITPVNANGQPIALGVHEADIEPYDFDPNTRIWTQFEMGLFRDMVFSNAFPSFEAANEASAELLRNILGTAYEENRPVSATMVLNYLQYLGHWRTQLHNSVRYWLDSYDFQNSNVPSEFATRRVGLLNYLLTNLRYVFVCIFLLLITIFRFARGGYTDTGRFMHSQAISDCIRVVLLNNRRAGRLTPLPDIVPRQCITLMTLMVLCLVLRIIYTNELR
ncbi:hypothetical protein BJV82DRAFT_614652 [Fennellomyces sp. T-0311]|nr:hypothetical protein BJV82DRAFT_614652 [Fennellomyces sp. T-0311]